jgi:hypothetical protein
VSIKPLHGTRLADGENPARNKQASAMIDLGQNIL